jgi:hypothetical protein
MSPRKKTQTIKEHFGIKRWRLMQFFC